MSKINEYFKNINNILKRVENEQGENIERTAKAMADTLMSGGRIHAFGTGHSHMLAEELFYRAGGLVNIDPILETGLMLHEGAAKSTALERLEGYGEILFETYGIKNGDLLFLFSNSGRNGVSVELALKAKSENVKTVVITNMEHTVKGASRHSSGKKLYEIGDIVIDNCGCYGDACITFDNFEKKSSPTSTVIGAAILNAAEARAIEIMLEAGYEPEVFASSNVDGGDKINDEYVRKYKTIVKAL